LERAFVQQLRLAQALTATGPEDALYLDDARRGLWLALVGRRVAGRVALWSPLLWLPASWRRVAAIGRRLVTPARLVALLIGSAGVPALPLWGAITAGIGLAAWLTALLPLWALRLIWRVSIVLTIGRIRRSTGATGSIRWLLLWMLALLRCARARIIWHASSSLMGLLGLLGLLALLAWLASRERLLPAARCLA
jgi:hypothetical protein